MKNLISILFVLWTLTVKSQVGPQPKHVECLPCSVDEIGLGVYHINFDVFITDTIMGPVYGQLYDLVNFQEGDTFISVLGPGYPDGYPGGNLNIGFDVTVGDLNYEAVAYCYVSFDSGNGYCECPPCAVYIPTSIQALDVPMNVWRQGEYLISNHPLSVNVYEISGRLMYSGQINDSLRVGTSPVLVFINGKCRLI